MLGYADTYVPGPLYCPYGLRVSASCVPYVRQVRAAQGSWCATVRTPCAYQPWACRTYGVPWHPRCKVLGADQGGTGAQRGSTSDLRARTWDDRACAQARQEGSTGAAEVLDRRVMR